MQVTNLKLESNMKEELLEAIYGTVERLEQKVDELSASTKNAGAETVPASNDITKLDKSINAMFSIGFFQSVIVLILSTLQSYFRLAFLNCLAYIIDYQYIFTIFCFCIFRPYFCFYLKTKSYFCR